MKLPWLRLKRMAGKLAGASTLLFLAAVPPVFGQQNAPVPQLKPIAGDANPMLDEMLSLPADQRNLSTESVEYPLNSSTANPNFGGFRVAPYTPSHVTGDTTKIIGSVEADFNQDGHQDMLVFQQTSMTLMEGDGKGGFTRASTQTLSGTPSIYHAYAVDLNHDGYPDIVAITAPFSYSGKVVVMLNQQNGTFSKPVVISTASSIYSGLTNINIADINGDGNLDIIVSGTGTQDSITYTNAIFQVYFGNGDGTFKAKVESDGILPYKATLGYDGGTVLRTVNGQLTLFAAVMTTQPLYDKNYNSTKIYEYPVSSTGAVSTGSPSYIDLGSMYTSQPTRYLQFVDLNGDGIPDLSFIQGDGEIYVALGKADGTFGSFNYALPINYLADTAVLSYRDVNGDGALDAVVAGSYFIAVYPGNGDGTFGTPKESYIGGFGTVSFNGLTFSPTANAIDDFNGDGNVDVVYFDTEKRAICFYKGLGDGTFYGAHDLVATSGNFPTNELPVYAVGDFNGDGYKDILINSSYGILSGLNDGKGNFTYQIAAPLLTSVGSIISTTADFNKDGKDDVVFLTQDKSSYYHIFIGYSNGDGTFTAKEAALPYKSTSPPLVTIGDINGDGYPDLVVTETLYSPLTYGVWPLINNGDGTFTAGTFISLGKSIYGLALGDVNGDGLPDLFVSYGAYASTTVAEWLNPGTGAFSTVTPTTVQSTLPVGQIVVKDATGDGKVDLLLAVSNGTSEGIQLYPGKGDGTFGTPSALVTGLVTSAIDVHDYNGDGIPDVVFMNYETVLADANDNQLGVVLLRGIGDGTFAAPVASAVYGASSRIFAADLVNNGSPSLLSMTPAGTSVLLNNGASTLSVQSSSTSLTTTGIATETVTVTPYYKDQATPTGTISLLLDGAAYATSTLGVSGTASFQLSSLSAGSHTVAATYAGDTNYNVNLHSGTTTLTVTKATPAFQLTSSNSSLTLQQGASGSLTIYLTANSAFSGPVSLSVSNSAPSNASFSLDQSSITLAPSQTATANLTIATQSSATMNAIPHPYGASGMALAGLLLAWPVVRRRRFLAAFMALFAVTAMCITGCNGSSSPKKADAGTYAVTVTATPVNTAIPAQSIALSVTIQNN